jgi:hypothetical protein
MMREQDVRQALYLTEVRRLIDESPHSLVVDELGVMEGKYRIDLAVINDRLHGFEIKSAADNLLRLAAQQESYSKIFDRMTLVADERHVAQALKIIPSWWGLIAVSMRDGQPFLNEIWPSRQNLGVDPLSLCQLLWRQEALALLEDLGLAHGVRTKSRKLMWRLLAAVLDLDELRACVSEILRRRTSWRQPDQVQTKPRSQPKRRRRRRRPRRRTAVTF